MASRKFSNTQIKQMAILYIKYKYTFEKIGELFNCSAKVISLALYKGITEGILDDNVADTLISCVINRDIRHTKSTEERWEGAWEIRKSRA